MGKSAVMVFSKDRVEGRWKWGGHELPKHSVISPSMEYGGEIWEGNRVK